MVAVVVPLEWKANRLRNQRRVVAEIERRGGTVDFSYNAGWFVRREPKWLMDSTANGVQG